MARERIFLDSASGGPINPAAIAAMSSAAKSAFAAQNALHSEGKMAASIRQAAIAQIADVLEITADQILPVSNPAQVFKIFADFLATTGEPVSINACSRKAFLGLLKTRLSAHVIPITAAGMEYDVPTSGWHVTQAGNAETGVISCLDEKSVPSGLKRIVDATEWIGRMPEMPTGEFKFIRGSSWGGGNLICFIIGPIKNLGLDALSIKAAAPEISSLVAAATALNDLPSLIENSANQRTWIEQFSEALENIESIKVLKNLGPSLPHILTFVVENIEAEFLAAELDRRGFAVGAGSACGIDSGQSHVLAAMGLQGVGNIRIGLPQVARQSDLEKLLAELPGAISAVRN